MALSAEELEGFPDIPFRTAPHYLFKYLYKADMISVQDKKSFRTKYRRHQRGGKIGVVYKNPRRIRERRYTIYDI